MEFYAIKEAGMEELKNINKIHASAREMLGRFSREVINAYGNNLNSITIYGSVLSNVFNPKKSDINVILVLNNTDLPQLKRCLPIVKRYSQKINPVLFTKRYIESSQDVYPIEFLEMKEKYLTIYGEDVFNEINVDRQYLRLECEQQLKGSLLKLRQGFLKSGLNRKGIEGLMNTSINTIFTVFRNLIRVKGEEPPAENERIIEKMADYYDLDKDIFTIIMRNKIGCEKINTRDMELCFDRYIKTLDNLVETVDKL